MNNSNENCRSSQSRESGLRSSYPPASSITSPLSASSSTVTPSPIYSEAGTEFVDVDDEVEDDEVAAPAFAEPPAQAAPQSSPPFRPTQSSPKALPAPSMQPVQLPYATIQQTSPAQPRRPGQQKLSVREPMRGM
jgi:hypothetical protein